VSSPNIDLFKKILLLLQEICNKNVITDPATPKRCRYTTLQHISFFSKIASTESTATADQASWC